MLDGAPQILIDLEQSGLGSAIRQSTWVYAVANTLHILALVVFFSAVAVMDLRLMGFLGRYAPYEIAGPAQRMILSAFAVQVASGFILFTAEASHVAMNPVFQVKMALVLAGLANAAAFNLYAAHEMVKAGPGEAVPARFRVAALISLSIWLMVAALGRLIAYF